MGIEIPDTGDVRVRRPDSAELLAIRASGSTCDYLLATVGDPTSRVATVGDLTSRVDAATPVGPALDALCTALVESVLAGQLARG